MNCFDRFYTMKRLEPNSMIRLYYPLSKDWIFHSNKERLEHLGASAWSFLTKYYQYYERRILDRLQILFLTLKNSNFQVGYPKLINILYALIKYSEFIIYYRNINGKPIFIYWKRVCRQ